MTAITFTKLGDVAQYLRGINFKPDDVADVGSEGTIACMRTKNIQELLDCSDVWGVSETFVRRPEQILREGDILVSSANSWNLVGKCCWIPKLPWKSSFGGFVSTLRADTKYLDARFLYWWFSSEKTQAMLRSFGQKTTNISNLNAARCLNLDVPLPALPEQRRIAAILDQADALRVKRREAVGQLDSLMRSVFIEMFADTLSSNSRLALSHYIEEFRYGTSNKSGAGGYPALRIPNVTSGSLDLKELKTVEVNDAEFLRLKLCEGDLLFVRTNGNPDNVGRCAVFNSLKVSDSGFDSSAFIYASYLIRARLKSDTVLPVVLQQYLSFGEGRQALRARSKTSAGQFNINTEGLGTLPIPSFPMPLQEAFIARKKAIEKQQTIQRSSLAELDTLFASLQHRAFRGEL